MATNCDEKEKSECVPLLREIKKIVSTDYYKKAQAFDSVNKDIFAIKNLVKILRKTVTYPDNPDGSTKIEVVLATPKLTIVVDRNGDVSVPKEIKALNGLGIFSYEDSCQLAEIVDDEIFKNKTT